MHRDASMRRVASPVIDYVRKSLLICSSPLSSKRTWWLCTGNSNGALSIHSLNQMMGDHLLKIGYIQRSIDYRRGTDSTRGNLVQMRRRG